MNTDIIKVLRKPRAPNVFFHKECYTSQEHHKEDLILEALRLRDDVKCVKCGIMIAKGDVCDRDVKVEKEMIVQQSLFYLEDVA